MALVMPTFFGPTNIPYLEAFALGCAVVVAAAAGFLRKRMGELIKLRNTPELRFVYDRSLDRGFQMDALLKRLADERNDL